MPEATSIDSLPQYRDAFREHERQVRISTGRLACWLVILLMPKYSTFLNMNWSMVTSALH